MAGQRDPAQRASDASALLLTAVAAAALLLSSRAFLRILAVKPAVRDTGIELTLQQEAEIPPTPPPAQPRPVTAPRAVTRAAPQPREPLPLIEEPAPLGADLIAADPTPPAPAAGPSRADLEAQYAAQLREDIDRRTHPPDTMEYRLHRPSGEVRVHFVVLRSGEPRAVALLRSSGSRLLDDAALGIVASGHYPPIPDKLFVGETQHPFAVTIEFRPPGSKP
jgi:protein TonB